MAKVTHNGAEIALGVTYIVGLGLKPTEQEIQDLRESLTGVLSIKYYNDIFSKVEHWIEIVLEQEMTINGMEVENGIEVLLEGVFGEGQSFVEDVYTNFQNAEKEQ